LLADDVVAAATVAGHDWIVLAAGKARSKAIPMVMTLKP